MESTGATTTNTAAATDGIQHDTVTYVAAAGDATKDYAEKQQPQMGMNVIKMPQMQYGAPQQQQQWKMM